MMFYQTIVMDRPLETLDLAIDPATAGQLLTRVRNGRSAFSRLCTLFEVEYPRLLEEIDAGRRNQDWARLRAAAHNLKGSAGVLGAVRVRACASTLNQSAIEGREPPADICDALSSEIQRFLDEARILNETQA